MIAADALHWAIRRAEEAEDRAARWIGWGRPSERAEEIATHTTAVERVQTLRSICDQLGIEQPPAPTRHPERTPTPSLFDHQEVGTAP